MLLFKPEHVGSIKNGVKTQTRRAWKKPRCKVGSIQRAKTVMLSKDYFAKLRILRVWEESLMSVLYISEKDAMAEGGYTPQSYYEKFYEINPKLRKLSNAEKVAYKIYAVEFELA